MTTIMYSIKRWLCLTTFQASLVLLGSLTWQSGGVAAESPGKLYFVSQGKTAQIDANGDNLQVLEFDVPNQVTWQPGHFFADGQRVVMLSMEPRQDGPGRPFDEYYTQTPTHIWIYNLETKELKEICNQERLAPFETPALLLGDDRILVQVVRDNVGQLFSMRLDGSDAREFTQAGEGLPYGLSLRPDGRRVAFHLATRVGYQVWTCKLDGSDRKMVAGHPEHLYFGTTWSPDGEWVLYVDCHYLEDPGHDWADVCIGRADGSEHRVLTTGRPMWLAASYGPEENHGSGSNSALWTRDGKILFPRRTPDAKPPWEFKANVADVDHFNRAYKPELACGGTEICRLDPDDGSIVALTHSEPPTWDFRASESPDGKSIVFCRASVGESPAVWVMDADGSNARPITRGLDDRGADHPRWLPLPAEAK